MDLPAGAAARWRPQIEQHQKAGMAAAKWFVPKSAFASMMRRLAIRFMQVPGLGRLIGGAIAGKSGAAI